MDSNSKGRKGQSKGKRGLDDLADGIATAAVAALGVAAALKWAASPRQEPVLGGLCIHDLPVRLCGVCMHHPDARPSADVYSPDTGWDYYDELNWH